MDVYQDRSIQELFSDLAREAGALMRQEVQLASAEMTQKATNAAKKSGLAAAGGAVLYAGFICLIAAIVIGLGTLIPLWLSALLVGLAVVSIGYVMLQTGISGIKHIDPKPQVTIRTLQENKVWAKEQLR